LSLKVSVVEQGARGTQAKGLGGWLAGMAPARARGEVTIAIVPDAAMRSLNKKFRGVNKATDVLSFPSQIGKRDKGRGKRALIPLPSSPIPDLGDVVLARGVAARQARALGHSVGIELRILALHGLLHLLGYDHEMDDGQMARVEGRLRRRAGLPDGLIARSS
jgi:probable rRNA maturation factor